MNESEHVLGKPIIFNRSKKKKKKRKTSTSLRDLQTMERQISKAMHRSVRAVDSGMSAYRKASKKSARKSKDGALVSFLPNVVKGTAVTMREMAFVPVDLVKAGYTRQGRRIVRRTVRAAARMSDELLP
ncbi:MAG: hypothetical protein GY943_05310 [Chloroflexi bacterium]|nr:hypothetical protein [Chloroflexota bacterium]